MEGIKLVNIDLSGVSKMDQYKKVLEEQDEWMSAMNAFFKVQSEENKTHAIEEFWDMFQATLGTLEKNGISAEELQAYYPKHLEKMKVRPRKKECKNCLYALKNCKLYMSEHWDGEYEAESCRTFDDGVR